MKLTTKEIALLAVLVVAVMLTSGCASVGPSAEQMKAMEGLSSSLCIKSPGWNGAAIEVHYASYGGKSSGTAGGDGEATCGNSVAKFTNQGKAPPTVKMIPDPK